MGDIKLNNLSLYYGNTMVFDGINETINSGETYVIIGASGCGKSSLLKVVSGLLPWATGEVVIDNNNIMNFNKKEMLDFHTRSGFVFEKGALISNLSIYDNLALYYHYHYPKMPEEDVADKILKYLDRIGMGDDVNNRPDSLSMGERMMVSIVRAISHNPDYLFFDEPIANLDIMASKKVSGIVKELKTQDVTMMIVTHNLKFAFDVADRIGIMNEGKIVESGNIADIKNSKLDITRSLLNLN